MKRYLQEMLIKTYKEFNKNVNCMSYRVYH
jgi:hypothetical protein